MLKPSSHKSTPTPMFDCKNSEDIYAALLVQPLQAARLFS